MPSSTPTNSYLLSEATTDNLPNDVISAANDIVGVLDAVYSSADGAGIPVNKLLKPVPGVGHALTLADIATSPADQQNRMVFGAAGSLIATTGATILVTGTLVAGGTALAPVLVGATFIVAAGVAGGVAFEYVYDGVDWYINEYNQPPTLADLYERSGLDPASVPDGFLPGDLVNLDDLVRLDGGIEIATDHSSYFKYNENFAEIWGVDQLGISQQVFETGLSQWISYLQQSGRVVDTTQAVFEYYEAVAERLGGNPAAVTSFNAAGAPLRQVYEALTSSDSLATYEYADDACFAPGTLVSMADGSTKPIEQVVAGDSVLSFAEYSDDGRGDLEPRDVVRTFVTPNQPLLRLGDVSVTPGHMMLNGDGQFRPLAEVIDKGQALVNMAGDVIPLPDVEQVDGRHTVYNFEVEGHHTYVAAGLRVHNRSLRSYLRPDETLSDHGFDANGVEYTESTAADGTKIRREGRDLNNDGTTDVIEEHHTFNQGENNQYTVTETWEASDGTNEGGIAPDGTLIGDGDLQVKDFAGEIINGQQLGGVIGSVFGNALGDNVIEDVIFSAALDSVFTAFGKSFDILRVGIEHKSGTVVDSFEEALEISFSDFGSRLGANIISAGIGQVSSFVVGELIGGDSLAADLGRTVANNFVSAALSDAFSDVAAQVGLEGISSFLNIPVSDVAGAIPVGDYFSFNPVNAIGSFLGSQLASSIVQAEGEAAGLVSSIFGTIGSIVGSSIPIIGTFIGQFVGQTFGALIGNALFGDQDYPRALGAVNIDANGRAVDAGSYTGVDGMAGNAIQPAVEAMVSGLNGMLDRFGPDARFTGVNGGNHLFAIGYISTGGYHGLSKGYTVANTDMASSFPSNTWNQAGFDQNDFNEAFKFAAVYAAQNGHLDGGDAWGRRVLYYGGWETFEQLMDQLQIAVDYRKYLENKGVIDRLIDESPDSSFATGWLITIGQAAALGFTNPDALHNLIEGTDVAETLAGTIYNDEIIGKAGNDTLQGGEGNDLLNGGLGADHLDGGVGLDTASYRDSSVGVSVNLETGATVGGDAAGDTFTSIERLFGSEHNDVLTGDAGDNLLAGYGGNDGLYGGAGDDTIEGGAGADTLRGGDGYDIATYAGSSVGVRVTLQEGATLGFGLDGDAQGDTLDGFEAISGSLYSDILTGNSADNMLLGSDGNDFLEGLGGADRLLGGSGVDFAVYTNSNAGVTVNLATGEASGGHAEGDTFDSIEYVIGSAHNDTITGDGFGNVIEGGAGADTLDGGEGMDAISYANSSAGIHIDLVNQTVRSLNVLQPSDATGDIISNFEHVIGTNFADEIIVGHDNAVILAGGGDDIITPFSGNVSIDGGDGYDTADFSRIDAGGDFQPLYAAGLFTGSQWQDVQIFQGSDIYAVWDQALQGAAVDENSFAAATNKYDIKLHSIEMLRATEFDDRIAFNDIGQHVDAAGGNDQMIGQSGNDVFYGGTGDDALDGAGGNDTLRGDEGDDVLHGGGGADALYGGDGNDTLQGDGQFNANPYGLYTVVDTGPQGSDYLDGGAGDDILRGGGANDVYRFGRGYGSDTIVDSAYVAGPPAAGKLGPVPTTVLADAGSDTISFADDILPTDIEATSIGDSLVLKIKGTSDQLTVTGMGHAFTAIENLQFDALGLTIDLTGLGAAGAASVISSIGNDAELFADGGTFTPHLATNVTEIAGLTDFNNDGTLDVAGVNGTQAFVAYGSGDAFTYAQVDSKGVPIPSSGIFHAVGTAVGVESETADIDGDGRAEIVSWRSSGTSQPYVRFAISGDVVAPNVAATQVNANIPWIDLANGGTFRSGDINGNGREQFVRARWTQSTNIHVETVSFANNGTATIATQNIDVSSTGLTSAVPFTWQLADINADGRDDLVVIAASATYVALAQPTAIGTLTQTSAGITYDASGVTKYATGDIDGDGYEDLVQVNQSTISVAFGNASGTLTTDPAFNVSTPTSVQDMFTGGAAFEVHLADKNGDGRDDFYVAGTSGVVVLTNNFAQTVGSVGNDVFVGTAGSDVFAGLAGNDQLTGGAGRDGLRGDEGADTLDGGADNDYLEGGAGNDTLIGGTGHDRAIYHSGAQYYTITQSGGNWIVTDINGADGNDGTDTLTGVEEAYFDGRIIKLDGTNNDPFATGSAQGHVIDPGTAFSYTLPAGLFHDVDVADTLTYSLVMADGRALPTWLSFNAATRTLSGTPGATDPDVLDLLAVASDGTSQASVPFRVAVRGTVSGTSGDDSLEGLGIYERMLAGDGNDTLKGSAGADILDGGAGVDTMDYSGSFFAINASLAGAVGTAGDAWGDQLSNIENIIGTKHADVIYGSSADNYIDTGAGEDWVDAGAGNDTIKVGSRSAYVIGGTGWDIVDYSDTPAASNGAGLFVNLSLPPGSILTPSLEGVEELIGTNWADAFTGDNTANTFRGGEGDDIFTAWGGNDTLEGGAGADNLNGGDGYDTASYEGSSSRVIVNLTSGTGSDGDAVGDTFTSIEALRGSAHNDLLYGDAGGNQLRGGAGHDHLWGYAGADYLDGGEGGDFARYDNSAAGVNVNLGADTATGGDATGDVLDNIEHLIGSNHNDVLTGDALGNTLYGLGGIDGLYGGAGNDVLLGGTGGDTIHGGDGIDRAQYSQSAAGVTINLFLTTAQSGGDAEGDILTSIENVYGSIHADTISGNHGVNTLWGNGGDDTIHANNGNDTLYGQDGNDFLVGQGGADYIDGGAGTDMASFHGSGVGVTVNLATGVHTGGTAEGDTLVSIENLQGSAHGDTLTGDAGSNLLSGLASNDLLEGGAGADTLDGGSGNDTASYHGSSSAVSVNLATGATSGGDAAGDVLISIERLYGSAFGDALAGDTLANGLYGRDGNDTLNGGAGADHLDGGTGIDIARYDGSASGVTVNLATGVHSGGDAAGDTLVGIEYLFGSAFNDTLTGDGLNNLLYGGLGNDTLVGGLGDDTLVGNAGADAMDGGDGIDTVQYITSTAGVQVNIAAGVGNAGDAAGDTYSSIERVIGSAYNDTVWLGSGGQWAYGGEGDDVLVSSASADHLDGEAGQDEANYNSSNAAVTVNLATGVHTGGTAEGDTLVSIEDVFGSNFDDTLTGDSAANTLTGFGGNDMLTGGAGADTLDGGGDHDVLYGQDGDDHLIGAGGHDTLEGGAGADTLDGGDGIDIARYDSSQSGVTVNLVTGTGVGGDAEGDVLTGIEQIAGSAYDDVLTGDAGTNLLAGYGGNDTLIGGAGADHFDGGTGVDIVSYAGSGVGVSVNLMTGATVGGDSVGDTFVSIESIVGTDHNDVLTGDGIANTIWGGIGNDGLYGEAGDDILVGGAGADTLDGGAGVDTVNYGSSTAGVQVNIAAGVGNAGDAAGDTYTSIERVIGSAHNDTAWLGSGGQWAYGGAGDDVLVSSVGADLLDGETGQDEANYNTSNAAVSVNLATGIHTGGTAEGDTLVSIEDVFGSNFNDGLTGDASANTLSGYGGDDTLEGGAGADTLDGGDGVDTASYAGSVAGVTVDLIAGTATGGDAEGDTLASIENVIGSAHNDAFYADAAANVIDGGAGADMVRYGSSTSAVHIDLGAGTASSGYAAGDVLTNIEYIVGSNYNDTLSGSSTNNLFYGGLGDDTLDGGSGVDTLYGGGEIDTLRGGDGNDNLFGEAGDDALIGGTGADILDGGDGIDTASYESSALGVSVNLTSGATQFGDAEGDALVSIENLIGSAHKDWLYGTEGTNTLQGGAGDDDLFAWGGSDVLLGGSGNDILFGGGGADTLDGGDGVDIASYQQASSGVAVNLGTGTGTAGEAAGDTLTNIENLTGSAYADTLVGDAGSNTLWGEAGDDVLQGGAGSNTLNGGLGTDTAIFNGNFTDYSVSLSGTTGTVAGLGETSSLVDIETLTFADRTVALNALNNAPILVAAVGNQMALRDVPFSLDVSGNFVDIDAADSLSYAATLADGSALPSWISIDAATGVLSGTATTSDMDLLAVKVIATDGSGATAETVFDLDVTRTNVAPVAGMIADQSGSEETAFAFTVPAATFTDADAGEVLTLSATLSDGSALPAWLSFDASTGAFSGTPTNTSAGVYSLAVTATDSFGEAATAAFDLTIANVNDAPTAANATGSVDEGQVYTLDLATLAADPDGDALTYSLPTFPGTGTTSLVGSVLTYTSVIGGFGPASIGYQVDDGNGEVANGTIDLTVNNINFAPTAGNFGATVNEGQGFTLDLSTLTNDLDGDALTYSINSGPAVGSASISGSTLTFNSTIGTSGNHNIGYTVSDGQGGTANGIVTATINDINFAPTASNSSRTVNEGQSFSINLATLVSDIDGDALSYSVSNNPAVGSVSISGSTLTYTSVNGQPGNYTIGYTVSDGQGGTANANIAANIIDLNYAPTAGDNTITFAATYVTVYPYITYAELMSNDTDPDGDALSIVSYSNFVGISGVNFAAASTSPLVYPDRVIATLTDATIAQTVSFDYTVSDGHGHTDTATVTINYTPAPPLSKPIAFDLDGDGVELVNADESDIFFDLNGDGEAEDTGWVDSDDALLAYDKNDDGVITEWDEVSFVGYKEGARTDLEGLQAFDTNGDGVLDASDAEYGSFNIWQDVNQNGVSDAGELRSLSAAGIASIALVSDETVRVVGDNVSFGIGQYTSVDGTTGNFSDTGFGTGQGLGEAAAGLAHVTDDSGLIAGADVIQLNASLEEVLDGHFQSSLVVSSDAEAGAQPTGEQNIAGLVSAMAAFDPKAGGDAQIGATDDDQQVPAIAAWVA